MIALFDLTSHRETLGAEIDSAISDLAQRGNFILGTAVDEFEKNIGGADDTYFVSCASGTDALILSLIAADIKPGDEVLVPAFTYAATANAIVAVGAIPKFFDVNVDDALTCIGSVEKALTERSKALIAVELYGNACDLNRLQALCNREELILISDSAQAFGARINNTLRIIDCVDFQTFSFFPTKPLGCYGDGGGVLVKSVEMATKLKSVRSQGRSVADKYHYERFGLNSRLDAIQAVVLNKKLKIAETERRNRLFNAQCMVDAARNKDRLRYVGPQSLENSSLGLLSFICDRVVASEANAYFTKLGIESSRYYPFPLPDCEAFKDYPSADGANSRFLAEHVFSIPCHAYLSTNEVTYICEAIEAFK